MLTLEELKNYIHLTDTDKDAALQGFINSAIAILDSQCNRSLVADTHTEYIRCCGNSNKIYLKNTPVNSIESIKYHDGTNYVNLIDGSGHTISNSTEFTSGFLLLRNNYSFLSRDIEVVYNAGYKFQVGTGRIRVLADDPKAVSAGAAYPTLFESEIALNDYIIFQGVRRKVTAIADDENLTISEGVLEDHLNATYVISNVPEDLKQGCLELAAMKYYESGLSGKNLLITSSEGMSSGASSSVNYKVPNHKELIDYYRHVNI